MSQNDEMTVDRIVDNIKFRIREYYWNENIVSRISAMRKIEYLAQVAIKELEEQHII